MLKEVIKNEKFLLDKKTMNSLTNLSNKEESIEVIEDRNREENLVLYEVMQNLAIISIDGAMYKKSLNGMCMSVISYPSIIKAIQKAENEPLVDTIIFRVDTPGGHVSGVEELRVNISNCKKKTVTLYENTGASAGVYAFMESKEVYATPLTRLGSIGVLVAIEEQDEETNKTTYITSQNASNKVCTKDCDIKIKEELNEIEDRFFKVLKNSTGFAKEQIVKQFNKGETISEQKALEIGFIDGILSFNELIDKKIKKNKNNNIEKMSKKDIIREKGDFLPNKELSIEELKKQHTIAIQKAREEEHKRVLEILDTPLEKEAEFIKEPLIRDISKTKEDISKVYFENREKIEANKNKNHNTTLLQKHTKEVNAINESIGNPVGEENMKDVIEKQKELNRKKEIEEVLSYVTTKPKGEIL